MAVFFGGAIHEELYAVDWSFLGEGRKELNHDAYLFFEFQKVAIMRSRKPVLFVSLFILVSFSPGAWKSFGFWKEFSMCRDNATWEEFIEKRGGFRKDPIVLFGDSQIEGWPMCFSFGMLPLLNRGVNGDTTTKTLERFSRDVLNNHPEAMVLLVGTNDLGERGGIHVLERNVEEIVKRARYFSIDVVVCSLLPSENHEKSGEILRANRILQNIAGRYSARYVDFFSLLAEENRSFDSKYTEDGTHPNQEGYFVMTQTLQPVLDDLS
ncbi:MAG: SGNH/GDSL hydrolase family protein [Desulfovibrionales bacterium]